VAGQLADEGRDPSNPELDVDAVSADINALNKKIDNASLLSRKEFVPKRVERLQCTADFGLSYVFDGFARGAPRLDDDFGGQQQNADLVDHHFLNLGGRNPRKPPEGGLSAVLIEAEYQAAASVDD
jgi:hypothetical protein